MIIDRHETEGSEIIRITAEGTNKITDKNYSFFTTMIYIPKGKVIEDYIEVDKETWTNFMGDKTTEFYLLKDEIASTNSSVIFLEEALLDTDYRVLAIEIQLEFDSSTIQGRMSVNYNMNNIKIGGVNVYELLKKRIQRQTYTSKNEMQVMLDRYYFAGRITGEQYDELTALLSEQEKL